MGATLFLFFCAFFGLCLCFCLCFCLFIDLDRNQRHHPRHIQIDRLHVDVRADRLDRRCPNEMLDDRVDGVYRSRGFGGCDDSRSEQYTARKACGVIQEELLVRDRHFQHKVREYVGGDVKTGLVFRKVPDLGPVRLKPLDALKKVVGNDDVGSHSEKEKEE